VEVVSPNDLFDEVDVKVEEFLRAGTRLIWVVGVETRQVYVHRADGSMSKVRADQELDGEDLLPGFRCRVDTLFPRPEEEASAADAADAPH
jgi:Uma2 family endonuclease